MGTLTLTKRIKPNFRNRYANIGWSVSDDGTTASKKQVVPYANDAELRIGSQRPYLTLCGEIQRPLGLHADSPLQRAVRFENVGNVKLNLTQALSVVESMWSLYRLHTLNLITTLRNGRSYPLTVFGNFDPDEVGAYQTYLLGAIAGTEYSEESLHLKYENAYVVQDGAFDFWFDVRNGAMFSFDRMFMQRIEHHLRASFGIMHGYLNGGGE